MANISRWTNPRYIDSSQSDKLMVGTLDTPLEFKRKGNLLTWASVDFAQFYNVYDNGVLVGTVVPTNYIMLEDAFSVGEHSVQIQAIGTYVSGDAVVDSKSALTEPIAFTVVQIEKPTIAFNDGTSELYFNSVDNADYYILYVNGKQYQRFESNYTSTNPYVLDLTEADRAYRITVEAFNTDLFLFRSSDTSNALEYTVIKLLAPVLTYTPDPAKITWDKIDYANMYTIYLNDEKDSDTLQTTHTFDDIQPAMDYATYVIATRTGQVEHPNPKYIDSDKSNVIKFGILATPIISINDNVISWDSISNAERYEIYNYNKLVVSIDDTSYALESSIPMAFHIQVKAVADGNISDSGLSNAIDYYITRLSAPTLSISGEDTIEWTSVLNADYYDVYVNNERVITETTATKLTLKLSSGYNNIYVVAKSKLYKYLDSYGSNLITTNVRANSQFFIKIMNPKTGEYTDYDVNLPIVFTETIDESMDTATVTLAPSNIHDPFEAYTDVSIYITGGTGNGSGMRYNFPKHMLISSDDVEAIQRGDSSQYLHHLSLIERTKLLETEIMPDFSITQDLDYVQQQYARGNGGQIQGKVGYGNKDGSTVDYFWYDESMTLFHDMFPSTMGATGAHTAIYGPHTSLSSIEARHLISDKLVLPVEASEGFRFIDNTRLNDAGITAMAWLAGAINPSYYLAKMAKEHRHNQSWESNNDTSIRLHRHWFIRKHNDTYDKVSGYTETEIYDSWDNKSPEIDISQYVEAGEKYDIIMTIDPVSIPKDMLEPTQYPSMHWNGVSYDFSSWDNFWRDFIAMGPFTIFGAEAIIDAATFEYDISSSGKTMNLMVPSGFKSTGDTVYDTDNTIPYRVIWPNILMYKEVTSVQKDDQDLPEHTTVLEALNKTLKVLNPVIYRNNKYEGQKYTLDSNIENLTRYLACPELKFENGKSLYEVLSVLGREFYGIPRLGIKGEVTPSNTITFDVMDAKTIEANNDFVDSNTNEDIDSTMENHATGYVSEVSNLVSSKYWNVFPNNYGWVTARSSSDTDPTISRDTMAIILDKPIYKLVDIQISNYSKSQSTILSLKSFINDKSVFDSLNPNQMGKGLSLYYERGDNKIMGFGALAMADELYAAMGWTSDEYVIQHILTDGLGVTNLKDVTEFRYRVYYIPMSNAKIYTEQSNISGLANTEYKALSQSDTTISDVNFGKSAQTQIERLGNNSIKKSYRLFNTGTEPHIGQIKTYDGYRYYADSITTSYNNNYDDITVTYSKNFNKINERIGVDSEYRLYRIYAAADVNRSINVNEYAYISTKLYGNSSDWLSDTNNRLVLDVLDSLNGHPQLKPDTFYVKQLKNGDSGIERLTYLNYEGDRKDVPCALIPASYNTFENTFSFTGKFYDNFSAGTRASDTKLTNNDEDVYTQQDVRYVSTSGKSELMNITLCKPTPAQLGYTDDRFAKCYPEAGFVSNTTKLNGSIWSETVDVDKDNRECINLVYQLHYQTFDKNLYIHSGIVSRTYKNAEYITGVKNIDDDGGVKYVFYRGDWNKKASVGDAYQDIGTPSISTYNNRIIIAPMEDYYASRDFDGFALVRKNTGEILFNYNTPIKADSDFTIPRMYINFSDKKLDYQDK